MATVATNDEGGLNVDWARRSVGVDADDAMVVAFDKAGNLVFHEEAEGGKVCGLRDEEVQEVPLRHEGDELRVRGKMSEVGYGE